MYGRSMGPVWLQRSILQPTYMGLTRDKFLGYIYMLINYISVRDMLFG